MSDPTAPAGAEGGPVPPFASPSGPPSIPSGPPQSYPGAPPPGPPPYAWSGTYPPAAYPYGAPSPSGPVAPGKRPIVLAIVALALAVLGLILAFIPIVAWFSGLFLLPAFVIALVALINKKQGGKGLAIAALAISVVGWIVSIVVAIASLSFIGQATRDILNDPGATGPQPEESETSEASPPAGNVQQLTVVESAFGRESFDSSTWWYVVILDNPNQDYVFDFASVDIEALDASGTILDTSPDYITVLSGRMAVAGSFFSVGQAEISSLNVRVPDASTAIASPINETGSFTVEGLTPTSDSFSTSVTGTVSGTFDEEKELVALVVVARAADGSILGAQTTYVDRLPVGGGKVQFTADFYDELPADATFEAYPSL